jgi:hypothetical protein
VIGFERGDIRRWWDRFARARWRLLGRCLRTRAQLVRRLTRIGWRWFRRQLRHYSGLISFLGIVILLGTFIVKDVLRDRQKDLLDSLEAAGAAWTVKQSTNNIDSKIDLLAREFKTWKTESEKDALRKFELVRSTTGVFLNSVVDEMAANAMLFERLPSALAKKYKRKQKEFEAEEKESGDRYFSLQSISISMSKPGKEEDSNREMSAVNDIWVVGLKLADLEMKVVQEKLDITKDFEDETAHATRLLKRFTILSYILYPLGVLIGALGQLAGAKASGAE